MARIPHLELTYGQMLWALWMGREPGPEAQDRARYLRQLEIPRPRSEGPGKGQRIVYGFDDLALLGFGLLGFAEGYKPRELKKYLVTLRAETLGEIRQAWTEFAEEFVEQNWTKMRGKRQPVRASPSWLRLHGRGRGEMAGVEFVRGEGTEKSPWLTPYEIIPGEEPAKVFEIDFWLPQWVAWAREAPRQPRGRQTFDDP